MINKQIMQRKAPKTALQYYVHFLAASFSLNFTFFQLIEFMTLFLAAMDARVSKFDVQLVYSLGDQFMLVSGMPKRNGNCSCLNYISF
jgi:hypothetical protein